jgi:S1-C subfamily serine protease
MPSSRLISWLPTVFVLLLALAQVVRDVLPAVVHIRTPERPMRPPGYQDPYQYFFQQPIPAGASSFPLGTGFMIQPRGYVVTSFQVIDGAQQLEVVSQQKKTWKARLVGGDRASDLALLKIEGTSQIPTLDFGDSQRILAGEAVLVIGFPLGFQPLMLTGGIAAKGNVLGAGAFNRHILLDVPTHPGVAGGPVIDLRGRVIGLATYTSEGPPHLGFVFPSAQLQDLVKDLVRHGRVVRPWLGLVARSLVTVDSIAEVYDPSIRSGLLVDNLIIDGPAAKAGLQVGDLLLTAGTVTLHEIVQLHDQLARMKAGERLAFKVFRRKQGFVTITVTLSDIPSAEDLPQTPDLL